MLDIGFPRTYTSIDHDANYRHYYTLFVWSHRTYYTRLYWVAEHCIFELFNTIIDAGYS